MRTYTRPVSESTGTGPVSGADAKRLVRAGYDMVSRRYRGDDDPGDERLQWIDELSVRLRPGASVLDLGCGCGLPVCRRLVDAGFAVTGVDISDVQIGRARRLVPGATFLRADATAVDLPRAGFDAVVSLYLLIHIPLDEQPALLDRIAGWLRPAGLLVATTGHQAWTGTEPDWNGWGAPMWWSHADAATYREWLVAVGFAIESEEFVPEGASGHALFRARRD
jgi:2-polyprenyl-3-methyl-5-hydroxy-6-metoxy-1,4-benzoquinol methylase